MKPIIKHSWYLTEQEARFLQIEMASEVIMEDKLNEVHIVAGVDVAYDKHSDKSVAAIVLLDPDSLTIIESVAAEDNIQFPYISGLFSFRELPLLLQAFSKLENIPDLIMCDGHGYSHPRRFGLACHLGVIFDIPTIGCAKSLLIGEYEEPSINRGSVMPIIDNGEIIGNALRTQNGIKPVFVSIGHRVSLTTSCKWVLKLAPKYRLPETTRLSDQAVRRLLKKCNHS